MSAHLAQMSSYSIMSIPVASDASELIFPFLRVLNTSGSMEIPETSESGPYLCLYF